MEDDEESRGDGGETASAASAIGLCLLLPNTPPKARKLTDAVYSYEL